MIFQSHPKNLHPKNLLKLFIIIHLYRIISVQRVTILEIEASRHKKIHRKQVFLAKYWLIQSVYHTEKDLFHINEHVNYVLKTVIMCSMMYSKFVWHWCGWSKFKHTEAEVNIKIWKILERFCALMHIQQKYLSRNTFRNYNLMHYKPFWDILKFSKLFHRSSIPIYVMQKSARAMWIMTSLHNGDKETESYNALFLKVKSNAITMSNEKSIAIMVENILKFKMLCTY